MHKAMEMIDILSIAALGVCPVGVSLQGSRPVPKSQMRKIFDLHVPQLRYFDIPHSVLHLVTYFDSKGDCNDIEGWVLRKAAAAEIKKMVISKRLS